MNIQEIRAKYAVDGFAKDDDASKLANIYSHNMKKNGKNLDKVGRDNLKLNAYINAANRKFGGDLKIYQNNEFEGGQPTFGINWAAKGTKSILETQAFIKKLQSAIDIIRNAPKAGAKGGSYY